MRHLIAALALLLIFSSCKEDSDNSLMAYRIAEEGLQQSVKGLSESTKLQYLELEHMMVDPSTMALAPIVQSPALEVKKLSDNIVGFIQALKVELKNETGANDQNSNRSSWENNLTVTNHVFNSHGRGKELLEKLIKYREEVLGVDPKVMYRFEHTMNIFSDAVPFDTTDAADFTQTFFSKMPAIAAYVILSKFEYNIRVIENYVVTFLRYQITSHGYFDEMLQPIIDQSSNCLKPGDELEITAGVGVFSTASNPRISVNNIPIPVNQNGVAIYVLKASTKAGKHSIPVKIEYTTPDGRTELMTKNVSYVVVE